MATLESFVLKGHEHNIPGIDFSSNGDFLVSCSIDGSCRIWNIDTGDLIANDIISNEWHWTAQFIRIEDVQPIKDFSKFFKGIRNSCEETIESRLLSEDDESMTDYSIDSWYSAQESPEIINYYDCIQDSKFLSNDLILSSSVTSLYLSQQYGQNLRVEACIQELSERDNHRYRDLDRLSIIKWIKELSIAIVVSQVGLVGIIRIVKYV